MIVAGSIRRRLRLLARSESGMALPTALFATVASLGLGGAAVMSSVDVQQGSSRDNGSKSAIAAADAGANVALQRLNRFGGTLSEEEPCIALNGAGQLETTVAASGWCPAIEGEVGGAAYSYRVSAAVGGTCNGYDVCVVSTGTASEVSRRISLSLDVDSLGIGSSQQKFEEELEKLTEGKDLTLQELKVIEEALVKKIEEEAHGGAIAGLVGRDAITMSGNASTGKGLGVATNGYLTTSGNISICGDVQTGIGKPWTPTINATQCKGYLNTQGTISLPPVSGFIPSDIATNNSNYRLVKCTNTTPTKVPTGCQSDTYSGGSWSSTTPWNPSTRAISAAGNTTLTFGGGDYWICSISLSGNSQIIMAKGAHVRFFFDTPEKCGTSNQISLSGNNTITATGYQGTIGQFDMPGFYLLGSEKMTSQASFSGNSSGNEFILYGPNTTISISGNAAKGMIVGKTVTLSGNAKIEQDVGFEAPPELRPPGDGSGAKSIEETKTKKQTEIEKLEEERKLLEELLENGVGSHSFHAEAYVECTGATVPPGTAPNANC